VITRKLLHQLHLMSRKCPSCPLQLSVEQSTVKGWLLWQASTVDCQSLQRLQTLHLYWGKSTSLSLIQAIGMLNTYVNIYRNQMITCSWSNCHSYMNFILSFHIRTTTWSASCSSTLFAYPGMWLVTVFELVNCFLTFTSRKSSL